MSDRAWRYLYSNSNIAGCLLGIIGMALYFGGIIADYWLAIVLGLYGVGALGVPRSQTWDLRQEMSQKEEQLQDALQKMTRRVKPRLTPGLAALLQELSDNLSYVIGKTAEFNASPFLVHFVTQTVTDYLPTAIQHYLNLPPAYRRLHIVKEGKTSSDLFGQQLQLLQDETLKVIDILHREDINAIEAHSRFLADKFRDYDLLS
ncbi:hypothetical protein WH50_02905 [Pokkaliibacter plantistimulans]|uniref:5-bromo-4-chloroindolyl phosphate hydrolysis protein n=1 Tax=Pokkaliibacter plantistimulans TaxID=1635171 RepID=A0ABX5M1I9_9GAMM|nr:hypothetical protein [Pokkaliibacter plantistimulans]PXF32754.1 hypothetical protein WH50_02905 [Pokkaliibacter plantistimulans]